MRGKNVVVAGPRGRDFKHVAHPERDEPVCRIVSGTRRSDPTWRRKDEIVVPTHRWCGCCRDLIEEGRVPEETAPRCEDCGRIRCTVVDDVDGGRLRLCPACSETQAGTAPAATVDSATATPGGGHDGD